MSKLKEKMSFSNLVALLALFVALGGSAYAATQLPKNSVGPRQLKKNAVTPAKLSGGARAALAGPVGPSGKAGPSGPTGPAGPSGTGPAFGVFQQSEEIELTKTSPKTVLTLTNLPAGSFAITAKAEISTGKAESSVVRCALSAEGAGSGEPPDVESTLIGNETMGSSAAASTNYEMLRTFNTAGGSVTLVCVELLPKGTPVEVSNARIQAVMVTSQNSVGG